ncbi:uncharacterized protein B0H18DRAFT_1039173 [Fomitopsis serialis]|uniref:uncharacterized protein n=1 Tax=Fomitopsis serialis TaxID=139415 RepID=UPI0020079F5E|nr:uncharacterized protein B0H18DRAFT_1039173 [Neoantrodia serialis]KAH9916077.1 hypothetical protein B0H18DRAFT_1039173 [Neoantrodia serialis]
MSSHGLPPPLTSVLPPVSCASPRNTRLVSRECKGDAPSYLRTTIWPITPPHALHLHPRTGCAFLRAFDATPSICPPHVCPCLHQVYTPFISTADIYSAVFDLQTNKSYTVSDFFCRGGGDSGCHVSRRLFWLALRTLRACSAPSSPLHLIAVLSFLCLLTLAVIHAMGAPCAAASIKKAADDHAPSGSSRGLLLLDIALPNARVPRTDGRCSAVDGLDD